MTQILNVTTPMAANENKAPGVEIEPPAPVRPGIAPKPNPRFRLLTVAELEKLPPASWFIEGILPENGLAVLYGDPGSYKTFLALDWALCASSGVPWHGHVVMKGNVVYVYAEGARGLRQRINAWRQARGGDAGQLRILPTALDMCGEGDVKELIAAIRAVDSDPALLVIDTLARCFGNGDENAQKDMNAFVRGCDMVRAAFPKCTVLVVHHAGKNPRGKDRGSTVLRGAADAVLSLAKGTAITLTCEKQKDEEEFKPIRLVPARKVLPDGSKSCVLKLATASVDASLGDPRAARNDEQALKALSTFGQAGAGHNAWGKASKLPPSTFKVASKRLLGSGQVTHDGTIYRVAEQGQNRVRTGPASPRPRRVRK